MMRLTVRRCVLAILGLLPSGWQRAPLLLLVCMDMHAGFSVHMQSKLLEARDK
jgi:hypothetical protein